MCRLPCFDRSSTAPGGSPSNSSVSSTISCGAAARFGSTRVTWKSFLPSLCTVSAPRTARSMMVAAVSRVSTCPSISSPASATGIRGGEKATGIGRSGSLGTTWRLLARPAGSCRARDRRTAGRGRSCATRATPTIGEPIEHAAPAPRRGRSARPSRPSVSLRPVGFEVRRVVGDQAGLDLDADGQTPWPAGRLAWRELADPVGDLVGRAGLVALDRPGEAAQLLRAAGHGGLDRRRRSIGGCPVQPGGVPVELVVAAGRCASRP